MGRRPPCPRRALPHDLPFACLRLLHFCEIVSSPGIRGLRSGIARLVCGKHLQNPASRPPQERQARNQKLAQRARADGKALDRFPLVRKPVDEEVVCRRAGIHPSHARQRLKLPYAVQLEHRPGREVREFLVVRGLECERSFAGNERTSARDGTAIEIEAKHEQASAAKGGIHDLSEIAATALRRRQRTAALPLPPTRLDPQELVDPARDVVLPSYFEMLDPAALAQTLLFATQPPAQVARYRRLGIGGLVGSRSEEHASELQS